MKKDKYGNINVLLLGYWGEGHDGGFLTDSIIIASRNPEVGNISMFSIPRDLRVKYPNGAYGRINGVFHNFLTKTQDHTLSASGFSENIGTMLNMEIPYFATIDFVAFKEVVDAIGGIDILIPETIHDTTYPNEANRGYITFHIDAGLQHLDGDIALKYARSRHSTSDFSRSLRQQQIIMGIKDKVLSSGLSLENAQELYGQYKTYVSTNITLSEMLRTVQYIKNLNNFTSFGFTTYCSYSNFLNMSSACFLYTPERELFWGASIILPLGATANRIQEYGKMQDFTRLIVSNPAFVKQNASIEVINGIDKQVARQNRMSGIPFAGNLAAKLKRYGFNIINTENAEFTGARSYISINNIGDFTPTIQVIQSFVSISDIRYNTGNVMTGQDEYGNEITYIDGADISLYLGADYLVGSESLSGLVQKKFSYDL